MIYIVAGVSGSGKSTVGSLLAEKLNIPFYDGDDYHPEANKHKMARGIPLTDEDRWPWLDILGKNIISWDKEGGAVLACSALIESYRQRLITIDRKKIIFIFLTGEQMLIADRIAKRTHKFYNNSLLDSQFDLLDVPVYGINIDIDKSTDDILDEILSNLAGKSQVGLIGLGVMGKSLVLNIARNKFSISVFNRHVPGKEEDVAKKFIEANTGYLLAGYDDLEEFVDSLASPKKVLLMVNAGKPVEFLIDALIPLLEPGDIILDAGNSLYLETIRREQKLAEHKINFFGVGVSGGEEGALKGPSIMPGGDKGAYINMAKILESISAKDKEGKPCVSYIGPDGAGHFVKMVHNGIEYAEMQLIAEVYQYFRFHAGYSLDEISVIFEDWNTTELKSYLLEISCDILKAKEDDSYILDTILDKSSSKGTGGWSTEASIMFGQSASTISEALAARFVSAQKATRVKIADRYQTGNTESSKIETASIAKALEIARIINHVIGFEIIREASNQNSWNINLPELARIWTNGCILRSTLMENFSDLDDAKENLLLQPELNEVILQQLDDLKKFIATALIDECPIPVFSAALNYFLQMKTAVLPATLIQAQRDYFGAHTYNRIDDPEGVYHRDWLYYSKG